MTNEEIIRGVLSHILEGSFIFERIKKEIDAFFKKYSAVKWLSLNQASTIHEILMSDKDGMDKQLAKYRELQLKRASEKDKWRKEVDGEKAINYFCEMIEGLPDRYYSLITEEIMDKFRLPITDTNYPLIYQSLIKTFDYIFITQLRISKKGGAECLKN